MPTREVGFFWCKFGQITILKPSMDGTSDGTYVTADAGDRRTRTRV